MNRAEANKKNYLAEIKAKEKTRQEKVRAEAKNRKAELLAARCLAREDNVMQLKKELFTASRKAEELTDSLTRETKRYVLLGACWTRHPNPNVYPNPTC